MDKDLFTVDELSEIKDLHNKDYLLEENDGCRDWRTCRFHNRIDIKWLYKEKG